MNVSVDSGSTWARSRRHASRRASELAAPHAGSRRREASDHRDPDGAGVEPPRVRADDVLVGAAVAAFVHSAEAIDEEVVADVVPAVRLHVIQLDASHDRGGLGRCVVVPARCVVDDASRTVAAYRGSLRRSASTGPSVRGTIGGAPARRVSAASSAARGCVRMRSAERIRDRRCGRRMPVEDRPTRVAERQPRDLRASRLLRSGRSSASGAAAIQAPQWPRGDRTRNDTVPVPRQRRPTRSKRAGARPRAIARRGGERHGSSSTRALP